MQSNVNVHCKCLGYATTCACCRHITAFDEALTNLTPAEHEIKTLHGLEEENFVVWTLKCLMSCSFLSWKFFLKVRAAENVCTNWKLAVVLKTVSMQEAP